MPKAQDGTGFALLGGGDPAFTLKLSLQTQPVQNPTALPVRLLYFWPQLTSAEALQGLATQP